MTQQITVTQLQGERWLPVIDYEGSYEVSDQGRVRSLERVVPSKKSGQPFRRIPGRIMADCYLNNGYAQVSLCRDGKHCVRTVHRVVLEAFVGPRPPGLEACHNDGDRTNNNLTNLRWDTHSANMRDQIRHGNHRPSQQTHCKRGHLFDDENTYHRPGDPETRVCRACKDMYNAELRRRRAEARLERFNQEAIA